MRIVISLARLVLALSCALSADAFAQEYYTRTAGSTAPGGRREVITGYPGMAGSVDIRVFASENDQSEPSIGLNWCNPINLLIGANTVGGFGYGQGYFYSENGGFTWSGSEVLPGIGYYTSDPSVAYDVYNVGNPNGYSSCYYNYLEFQSFSYVLKVAKTTDGGVSWLPSVQIPDAGDPDKNHITCDPTTGAYSNFLYTGYTDFSFFPGSPVRISRSTNRGSTFSVPVNVSQGETSLFSQGVNLAVGPSGEAYAVWSIYDDWSDFDPDVWGEEAIGFARSTNGGLTWQAPERILEVDGIRNLWTHKNSGGSATPIRVNGFPSMAIDRSGGPYHGYMYVTWANKGLGSDKADILLTRSTNNGVTWSIPVRVNDDNTANDQWFPWITVSPWGRITIVFYDSRADLTPPVNQMTEAWIAESTDGGLTFANARVSDVAFMPAPVPGTATGYMGDYLTITSKGGYSYPCWPDSRTGAYQLFVDIQNTYAADLQNVASWNRSPVQFATTYGSSPKILYAGGIWHRLIHVNEHLAYAQSLDDGATWVNHALINGAAVGWLSNPSLLYSGGKLHSVFRTDGSNLYYLRGTTAGNWDLPRVLTVVPGTLTAVASAIDDNGIGHVAYVFLHSQTGSHVLVYGTFNTLDVNSVLGETFNLATSYALIEGPAIGLDPATGFPHVVWSSGGEILYRHRAGPFWSSGLNVSATPGTSRLPDITIQGDQLHLVWQEDTPGNSEIYYRSKPLGGSFGETRNLSNTATTSIEPGIVELLDGAPLVFWSDSLGDNLDIRYARPVSGETGVMASTPLQSHHPVCGVRRITGGSRVVYLCTDGTSSLYQIACGKKDFPLHAKAAGEAGGGHPEETGLVLLQNSPNPFNPTTTIRFTLPDGGRAELSVFDILGKEVAVIIDEYRTAGSHEVTFDGRALPTGIYFCRLRHSGGTRIGRMILSK